MTTFFCIQSLNMTLSKESSKPILDFKEFAVNIANEHQQLIEKCAFVKNSKPDVIIETSILVLGLLSYVHSKDAYQSIFLWIEKVF